MELFFIFFAIFLILLVVFTFIYSSVSTMNELPKIFVRKKK